MSVLDSSLQRWPIFCLWSLFLTKEFHFLPICSFLNCFMKNQELKIHQPDLGKFSQENWVSLRLSLSLRLAGIFHTSHHYPPTLSLTSLLLSTLISCFTLLKMGQKNYAKYYPNLPLGLPLLTITYFQGMSGKVSSRPHRQLGIQSIGSLPSGFALSTLH